MISFTLLTPAHSLANDATVKAVFVNRALNEDGSPFDKVAIDYQSGILLYLEQVSGDLALDPAKELAEDAAAFPSDAMVKEVHGVPALVVEPQSEDGSMAVVILVLNDLRVVVYAKFAPIPSSDLVEVAQTIA